MLELKGVEYELAGVLPGMQRVHLRLAGFRGGTVPAIVLDGRRIQGTPAIARALGFPTGDEELERWADGELQNTPRRMLRWGLVRHQHLRTWVSSTTSVPAPGVAAGLSVPTAWYYARAVDADEAHVRRHVAELPQTLDRVDALLADAVIGGDDALTLEILCSIRALEGFTDLHDRVAPRRCAAAARAQFPDWPGAVPAFLPAAWLPDGRTSTAAG
jgi:glutathione S-transferase